MKECCSSCDYCKFDSTYVNPYQCRKEKPYHRFSESEAYENSCKDWKHGTLKSNYMYGVELAKALKLH